MRCSFCGDDRFQLYPRIRVARCSCGVGFYTGDTAADERFASGGYFALLRDSRAQSELIFDRWVKTLLAYVPAGPGRVLDVGFGYGIFLSKLAEKGWETYGVEVSEPACDHLRASVPGAVALRGSVADAHIQARLQDTRFDVVTFWDCLQCMPDAVGQLEAAVRLLRPGGVLVVQVPNRDAHNLAYASAWARIHPELGRFFLHIPAAKLFFDSAALARYLVRIGLSGSLQEPEPVTRVNWRPRLGSLAAFVESVMAGGWQLVAKRNAVPNSIVLITRKLATAASVTANISRVESA